MVTSGLKAQHRNTFLGYLWWLLDPLLGVAIYYFVVGVVFGRGGPEYLMNLVVGLAVWRWFQTSVSSAARSITARAGIISQVYLPKVILPASAVISELVNFGFGLCVAILFVISTWQVPGAALVWLPVVTLVLFLFILAIALPVAYVSVFVRDMDNLLGHLLRVWFYASPLIWTVDSLPDWSRWLVALNPMAHFLSSFRDILLYNQPPDVGALSVLGLGSIGVLSWAIYYYCRNEHRLIKVL